MIFIADEASSNRRLFAQAQRRCAELRPKMLTWLGPCLLHVLHRSIVPCLKHNNSLNDLFRAAHVLIVGAYWSALIRRLHSVLLARMVVTHHQASHNPEHRMVAEGLLDMTLGQGMPEESWSRKNRELKQDMLGCLCGDWTSQTPRYHCRDPTCNGGDDCQKTAADHVLHLLLHTMFARKVIVPSASRWYKFAPLARQVLLGIGLHGLWAQLAPASWRRPAGHAGDQAEEAVPGGDVEYADGELDWHAIHAWRVRKTYDFFHRADTASNLILVLQSLQLPHTIMRWLMKYESSVRRSQSCMDYADDEEDIYKMSAADIALVFLSPSTSPVTKTLAEGASMLLEEQRHRHWRCFFRFHPLVREQRYHAGLASFASGACSHL